MFEQRNLVAKAADVAEAAGKIRAANERLGILRDITSDAWGEGYGAGWIDCLLDLENGGAKMSRNPYPAAVAAADGGGE